MVAYGGNIDCCQYVSSELVHAQQRTSDSALSSRALKNGAARTLPRTSGNSELTSSQTLHAYTTDTMSSGNTNQSVCSSLQSLDEGVVDSCASRSPQLSVPSLKGLSKWSSVSRASRIGRARCELSPVMSGRSAHEDQRTLRHNGQDKDVASPRDLERMCAHEHKRMTPRKTPRTVGSIVPSKLKDGWEADSEDSGASEDEKGNPGCSEALTRDIRASWVNSRISLTGSEGLTTSTATQEVRLLEPQSHCALLQVAMMCLPCVMCLSIVPQALHEGVWCIRDTWL
jgi:hypothetical protein